MKIGNHQQISINLWYHEVDRQIAPTVKDVAQKKTTDAIQNDDYYRTSAQWGYRKNKTEVAVRSGYFVSQTNYAKPVANDKSKTRGESWQSEAEATYRLTTALTVNGGLHYTHEKAESSSYGSRHYRNREAAFGSLRYLSPVQTKVTANARVETTEATSPEPTFTLGIDQPIWSGLSATAKAGTSYRVPSFNDLYWQSATAVGNPDLKPEEGNNLEGGLAWKSAGRTLRFDAAVTAYTMHMKNWMSWGANSEGVYTVLNQDSANIKGIESRLGLMLGQNNANISLQSVYTYTDARDPKTDNYLPYVPMHKGSITLAATYRGNSCWINPTYTSEVQTNAANTSRLDGYKVLNVGLSKRIGFGGNQLILSALANNLLNTYYQTRQYYPMPGRYFQLSATVNVL
jgi:vitamin B12 transporter